MAGNNFREQMQARVNTLEAELAGYDEKREEVWRLKAAIAAMDVPKRPLPRELPADRVVESQETWLRRVAPPPPEPERRGSDCNYA